MNKTQSDLHTCIPPEMKHRWTNMLSWKVPKINKVIYAPVCHQIYMNKPFILKSTKIGTQIKHQVIYTPVSHQKYTEYLFEFVDPLNI